MVVLGALLSVAACERAPDDPRPPEAPATAAPGTLWRVVGAWSGRGNRQTESFDVTSGSLRLVWETRDEVEPGAGYLRVSLYSAISGRITEPVIDVSGEGADTVQLASEPRVAYLLIESDRIDWSMSLEEGVRDAPEAARPPGG